jgi:hypothetical protein
MASGHDIISSDTNFNPRHETYFRQICKQHGYDFEVKFFDISLDEAIKRDLKRENPVGENVIKEMYAKYIRPTKQFYLENPALDNRCIIVDLDGTLCLFGDNNPYDRDFTKDFCNYPVKSVIDSQFYNGITVFLFSGRDSKFRGDTVQWLKDNRIHYDKLVMRAEGDKRPDDIIKREFFDTYIDNKYNVNFVIDDRKRVIRMWRDIGLFVFDVNQSEVDF